MNLTNDQFANLQSLIEQYGDIHDIPLSKFRKAIGWKPAYWYCSPCRKRIHEDKILTAVHVIAMCPFCFNIHLQKVKLKTTYAHPKQPHSLQSE